MWMGSAEGLERGGIGRVAGFLFLGRGELFVGHNGRPSWVFGATWSIIRRASCQGGSERVARAAVPEGPANHAPLFSVEKTLAIQCSPTSEPSKSFMSKLGKQCFPNLNPPATILFAKASTTLRHKAPSRIVRLLRENWSDAV